jgi:hypothetical protein
MKITQAKCDAKMTAAGRAVTGVAHVAEIAHGDGGTVRHCSFIMQLTDDQLHGAAADLTLGDGRRAGVHVHGWVTQPGYFAIAGTGFIL